MHDHLPQPRFVPYFAKPTHFFFFFFGQDLPTSLCLLKETQSLILYIGKAPKRRAFISPTIFIVAIYIMGKQADQLAVPTITRRNHVAVLSFPFASHPSALLSVLRSVSAASHKTTNFSFFSTQKFTKTLFPTQPDPRFPNITPYDVHNGLPEGFQPRLGPPIEEVGLFLKSALGNFRAAIEAAEEAVGCKVSCLMSDAFLWFAAEMAADMGVPWIPVFCSGPLSLIAHVETDLIRDTVGLRTGSGKCCCCCFEYLFINPNI